MKPLILISFISIIFNGICFNIDTKYPIVYFYNNTQLNTTSFLRNSHFGYSVILYKGVPYNQSWIQIGAPKSNDTNNYYFQPGAVFRCPINQPCNLFPLDASEIMKTSRPVNVGRKMYQPKKDEAWIGGSMDIDMKNERVVVCGHRWINNRTYTNVGLYEYEYHITGACYWSKSNQNFTEELLPITGIQGNWYTRGVYFHTNGQAGSSVHIPFSDSPQLLIGAPGILNWKGSVIKYEDAKQRNIQQFSKPYIDFLVSDPKGIPSFSYFGYSICSGNFFSSQKLLYVAGAPRAESYKGKIIVFELDNKGQELVRDSKQGTMTGEYFGAAIAVGDINGDHLDDIIVGAPRYNIEMDEGRIYIYYGHIGGSLRQPSTINAITGKAIGGQFGSAIQSLGDLDLDGCADIAVGAPYENENHGVVYIYNGQKKEDPLKLSQKIEGKNIYPLIKGFGISFSRPTDIDGNNVDDLAIGSYLSENAVILRSRPVVTLKIQKKKHNLNLERNTTSFTIEVCLSYKGKYVPEQLDVIRKIKMDENYRRVFLLEDKQRYVEHLQKITLNAKFDNCANITFGLIPTTNYLDPVKIIVSQDIPEYSQVSQPILINQYTKLEDKFCKSCPIVKNTTSMKEIKIDIPYTLNCGSDNICDSDLTVKAEFQNLKTKNEFVIGSQSFVSLKINVTNKKEYAYLTQVEVKLPENIHLQEVPTNCNEDINNFTFIICDVENPLKTNASKIITLNFDMSYITNSSQEFLLFDVKVKSKSGEINITDNYIISRLNLATSAFIEIKGNSETDVYYYQNKTKLINSSHLYKVQKSGVSPLNYFKLNISIPVALNREIGPQKFLSIFQPIGVQGDQSFSCNWDDLYNTLEEKTESLENRMDVDVIPTSTFNRSKRFLLHDINKSKNNNGTSEMFIVPITNKVAFLNCSTTNIICKSLICEIGPFQRTLKVVSLQIKMVLNMTILEEYILTKDKSIIYLSTDGSVKEISGKRYANVRVSNVFMQEPVAQKIALWIIIVSIIVGIFILLLIVLGLVKTGFFERKAKVELEALKQQEVIH